jgi:peptide deformylase
MTVLPVFRMGAEVLKLRAEEIADVTDPEIRQLADDMLQTMVAEQGVGLAAPQVGASVRMVLFFVPGDRNEGDEIPLTVMANPVIESLTEEKEDGWEACLSVPGLTARVPRWTHIRYSFTDLEGNRQSHEARDFHARVVQHECDHLDGVLYPMRVTDLSSLGFSDVIHAEAQAAGTSVEMDEEGVPLE